jgi:hypothetical protein
MLPGHYLGCSGWRGAACNMWRYFSQCTVRHSCKSVCKPCKLGEIVSWIVAVVILNNVLEMTHFVRSNMQWLLVCHMMICMYRIILIVYTDTTQPTATWIQNWSPHKMILNARTLTLNSKIYISKIYDDSACILTERVWLQGSPWALVYQASSWRLPGPQVPTVPVSKGLYP